MKEIRRSKSAIKVTYGIQKRILAFLLTAAMVFTNVGMDLNTAFAAGSSESVTFSMSGAELVDAIDEAVVDGNVVTGEDLDFTNGKTTEFETLFFGGKGILYEAFPETDGGSMEAELRVFVRLPEDADDMYMVTGDEEIIFLYVNNGEDTISCTTEITRMEDGEEKVKKTKRVTIKSYEAAFGDEEVNIISKPTEETKAQEETKENTVKETAVPKESETQDEISVPSDGGSIAAPDESTSSSEAPTLPNEGEAAYPEETQTEDTTEDVETKETETKETVAKETEAKEAEVNAAKKDEAAAEEKEDKKTEDSKAKGSEHEADETEAPETPDEPMASIIRHFAPVVADKEDGEASDPSAKKETEASESRKTENIIAKETEAPAKEETKEELIKEEATEESVKEEATKASEKEEAATETGTAAEETPESSESSSPEADNENEGKDITVAETDPSESTDDVTDSSDSSANVPSVSESIPSESETVPETSHQVDIEETAEAPEAEDHVAKVSTSDLVGMGYCSTAKVYITTIKDIKAMDDIAGYKISYEITPDPYARIIEGPRSVEEGEQLSFGVKMKEGYSIVSVTANGMELEPVDVADDEVLDGIVDRSGLMESDYAYILDEIYEEQEICVEVGPALIPAADYTAETDDVVVTVSVPEGAFNEAVELQVSKIEDEAELKNLEQQANEVLDQGRAVAGIIAYDISFLSEDGEEQEPEKQVSVSMSFKKSLIPEDLEVSETSNISVIHLPDNGSAETVAASKDITASAINFSLDSFSPVILTIGTDAVASNNGKEYATLQGAIDDAENGDTIRLEVDLKPARKNVQGGENVEINEKILTIDTNGKSWTGQKLKAADADAIPKGVKSVISVKNSTLSLIGDGTIIGYDLYRVITAENSHLIIGTEGGNGPTLRGTKQSTNNSTPLSKEKITNMGGVILADQGSITLNGGTIIKGKVYGTSSKKAYGGGIAVLNGSFTMNGGSIEGNWAKTAYIKSPSTNTTAHVFGGGVYLKETQFEMNGGTISGNYARYSDKYANTSSAGEGYGGNGGGIYSDSSEIIINKGEIKGNYARGDGGGISASESDVTINGGSIQENVISNGKTTAYGGGINFFTNKGRSFTVNGGTISGNSSKSGSGGGIYSNGSLTITGGEISGNEAKDIGGGIYTTGLNMDGGTISDNSAENGGGIYCNLTTDDAVDITNAAINGNKAVENGGGIYYKTSYENKQFSLDHVTITGNEAQKGGGIAALSYKRGTSFKISENTKVYNNTASGDRSPETNMSSKVSVSDEFLFINDSNFVKIGFDEIDDAVSGLHGATSHVVSLQEDGSAETYVYILVNGGKSLVSNAVGYYNHQDTEIKPEDCVSRENIYLDPLERSRHFIINDEQKGERLTKENGLFTSLKEACEAAQGRSVTTIYICSPVILTSSDEKYLNNPNITFVRCEGNHGDALFGISGTVTMNGAHISGEDVTASTAMISVPAGATLNITGNTCLEKAKNTESNGGAISVSGTLYMDGGIIQNSSAKSGGAVYVNRGTAHFEGGSLTGNIAEGDGGAIYVHDRATIKVGTDENASSRTIISQNTCGSEGGGITLNEFSTGYIYRADIIDNIDNLPSSNSAAGGGIHIWAGCTMYMKNLYMTENVLHGGQRNLGALYSCPTGKLAIFEMDGALTVDNGEDIPDIVVNNSNPAFVSNVALGGGDITYYWDTAKAKKADSSEYQYVMKPFSLYSSVSEDTKEDAALIANRNGVVMTGNQSWSAGSAIANNGTLIIGTETEALQVVKEWKDADGSELAEHPSEVLVYLTKTINGVTSMVKTDGRSDGYVSLNAGNNWTYTWENLSAVTDPEDGGKIITWGVAEANVSGYTGTATDPEKIPGVGDIVKMAYRITLTNTKGENPDQGDLTVKKTVYADAAAGIFRFKTKLDFKDAEGGKGSYSYYITNAAGIRSGLHPVYDTDAIEVELKSGEAFTIEGLPVGTGYTVEETEESRQNYLVYIDGNLTSGTENGIVSGTMNHNGSADASVAIEFTNVEPVSVKGIKEWNIPAGTMIPESITVNLLQTGVNSEQKVYDSKIVTAGEDGLWSYEWNDLPGYDLDGNKNTYMVDEVNLPAYSKSIGMDSENGIWKITNTLRTGVFNVTVYKTLTGKTLEAGQFSFELKDSSGKVLAQAKNGEPDSDGRAKVEFTDISLPEYDGIGTYTYTIHEVNDNQSGYQYDEGDITVSVLSGVDEENDSRLTAVVTVSGDKNTFVNTYTTPSNPGGGGSSGGGSSSGGGGHRVTITPEGVPLAVLPEYPVDPILIDDGEIPLAALPKTGQSAVKATFTMMISGILLMLTVMNKKRKEE